MRPIHLTISGWGPYKGECNIDFNEFDGKGLFLITGATGAGKTSVFDAICFALYGDVSGGMREKNSVRSDFADAETKTYVELVMEHGGDVYKIYRNPEYERPKKRKAGGSAYTKERENAILYMPGGKIIEGSQDVTRKIQEILVLNLKQFKQISMIAQGEFSRLLMAPSREKIAIFREIFGTGIYEEFENVLRQRAKTLYGEAATLKNKLDEAVRMLSLPDEEYEQLTASENLNYENIYEYLKSIEKEYDKRAKESSKEYAKLDKESIKLTALITKTEERNRQLIKLQECKLRMEVLEGRKKDMLALEKELKQAHNAGYIMPFYVKLQELETRLTTMRDSLAEAKEYLKKLKNEKKSLQKIYDSKDIIATVIRLKEEFEKTQKQYMTQLSIIEKCKNDTDALSAKYLDQEQICKKKNHEYEDADYAYRRATAGIVARMLREGEPCPVCGSLNHPSPARAGDDVPDENQLKLLKKQAKEAEDALLNLHTLIVEKKTTCEAEEKKRSELCGLLEQQQTGIRKSEKYMEAFTGLSVQECYDRLADITGRYQKLEGLIAQNESYIQKNAEEIIKDTEELASGKDTLKAMVKEHGFGSVAGFVDSSRSREEQQVMSDTLQDFNEEKTALKELIGQLGKGKVKDVVDVQSLKDRANVLEAEKQRLLNEQKHWDIYTDAIKRTINSIREKLDDLRRVSGEYGYVKDLDNVASGMNPKRLVFEQYVLATYFEEILRAANIRFMKMTAGRYEMSRLETASDGRSRDNLEIQVFDYYTGKYRSVKTLSGGESFKASLSLALGMSDVIQAFHGGIRVDTLFVDEGFGTLDGESLEQACETLRTLVEKDRFVGIISHVPELRERIEHQIIVHKTSSGSTIQLVV